MVAFGPLVPLAYGTLWVVPWPVVPCGPIIPMALATAFLDVPIYTVASDPTVVCWLVHASTTPIYGSEWGERIL